MSEKNVQLKIGAFLSYFSIAFNIIAGILYTPWMIEQIGQSDYGLYTLANSVISMFLLDLGLSTATSRFIAKYRAENRNDEITLLLSAVYKLYFLLDVVILVMLIIYYCFINQIYVNFTELELQKFKVVFCIVGVYSLISFPCITFNGILNAYEKFIPMKLADFLQRGGAIILTVICLVLGADLYGIVIINALCGVISNGVKYVHIRALVKIRFQRNKRALYAEVMSFSLWSTIYALAQRLVFNIMPTIIGVTVEAASSAIAVFGIITTIESYVYTVTTAINGMFLSKITRIIQVDKEGEALTRLAIKVGKFQYVLNGMIIVCFLLAGKDFILLWVGEAYVEAYLGIMLVIIPQLFYNALQIMHTAMVAQNLVKYQAGIQLITGICNVILATLFSNEWGVIGAAFSICIAYTIRVVLTFILIHKRMKMNLKLFLKECYCKMLVPMLASGMLSGFLVQNIEGNQWVTFIFKCSIIVIIYILSVWLLGISKEEKLVIMAKIQAFWRHF